MEGEYDSAGDDAEVHGETEPGEKSAFVGAVVAAVGGSVVEHEGAEEGAGEDDGAVGGKEVSGTISLWSYMDERIENTHRCGLA